jgi:oligoribonuclease NrnB/cAMP/cGMP phosphodiesterase (DHH superfamily)
MIWLLYHSADLDGHSSGAILRWYHESQGLKKDVDFKMAGLDYGRPWDETQIQDGDTVFMSDISLQPYERMAVLNKRVDLFVFDHHATVVPTLEAEGIKGAWGDDTIAGCEVTWAYLINAGKVPEFIKLLSTWDCLQDQDKVYWNEKVKPFQMGVRMYETEPSTDKGWKFWQPFLLDSVFRMPNENFIKDKIVEGNTIIKYQTEMNKDLMQRSFEMTFEGLRLIVVNGYKGSPQFDSVWDEGKYDAMMSFYNRGNKNWTISLYTTKNDLDLSKVAEKWGGGGHPKACGFHVDDIRTVIGDTVK